MSEAVDLTHEGDNTKSMDMDITCEEPIISSSSQQVKILFITLFFWSVCLWFDFWPLFLQAEAPDVAEQQTMRVYLRVRPFSKEELAENKGQVRTECKR